MNDDSLHIALVIERFDPYAGGAERSTAQIAAELVRRGHRVTVLTGRRSRRGHRRSRTAAAAETGATGAKSTDEAEHPPSFADSGRADADAEVAPGVEVIEWRHRVAGWVTLLGFSRWVRGQLAQGPFDVSLSVTMAASARVVQPRGGTVRETLDRNVAMRTGALNRAVKRATIYLTPKYLVQLALERRVLRDPRVAQVVAISDYVAAQLRRHYGVDPRRIELIPNAAAMPVASAAQRQAWREAVRSTFGIADDATVFLFAAQNPGLKGFEPLLAAMRLLRDRGAAVTLLLAGGFWYAHHKRVCELKLREQVRFVRQTRRMPALYAAADATVLPTFYDPCSKVVIESLMMGTPAISSGFNGASDFIAPPDAPPRGLVVPDPWDVSGLADAMAQLTDPARRQALAAATGGLNAQLGMTRHVDQLERVLREAAGSVAAGGVGAQG